jgi:hypothetical protein
LLISFFVYSRKLKVFSELSKDDIVRKEQHVIQANDNQLYTMKQSKLALNKINQSEFKSHIIDKVNTMNYGHYKLRGKYTIHRN